MEFKMQNIAGLNGYIYPVLKGSNYYCVPTCLRMVMASMNYFVEDQEILKYFELYTNVDTNDENQYGIHINNGDLDNLFTRLNIPLTEKYIPISHIPDIQFTELICQLLKERNHVLCGYSYGFLFSKQELLKIGHVSIIANTNEKYVDIIDPGPDSFGIKQVKEDVLYDSIRYKGDGLWVLRAKI